MFLKGQTLIKIKTQVSPVCFGLESKSRALIAKRSSSGLELLYALEK